MHLHLVIAIPMYGSGHELSHCHQLDSIKLQSNPKNAHRISDWIFLWQVYLFKNQEKQLVDFLCINFGFRWENADSMPDG